jgi:rhamnose transport system ATP-binding protein
MALGIKRRVYQEPQLFSELTVSENIFMGREIRKGGRIDWPNKLAGVVELSALLELPPRYATAVVGDLSTPSASRCRSPRPWPARRTS